MNELEIFYFRHDVKRYGLVPAMRINAFRLTLDDVRKLSINDIFPLTSELAETRFAPLKINIFNVFLEHVQEKPIDLIAKEFTSSEKFLPKSEQYNPATLLMEALVKKIGPKKKSWEKAAELFSHHEELSRLIEEHIPKTK